MLKLSVGKGREVIKQLCRSVLRYSGYRAHGVCALVVPRLTTSPFIASIDKRHHSLVM